MKREERKENRRRRGTGWDLKEVGEGATEKNIAREKKQGGEGKVREAGVGYVREVRVGTTASGRRWSWRGRAAVLYGAVARVARG